MVVLGELLVKAEEEEELGQLAELEAIGVRLEVAGQAGFMVTELEARALMEEVTQVLKEVEESVLEEVLEWALMEVEEEKEDLEL